MLSTKRRLLTGMSVLLAGIMAAGCSSPESDASRSLDTGDARFFETAERDWLYDVYSYASSDMGEFAAASDVVFVGSIVGTRRGVAESPLGEDPGDAGQVVLELDGVTFAVEEVISGKDLADGERTVVAHPVVVRGIQFEDAGGERSPADPQVVEVEPISVIRDGIREVEAGRPSPNYLIFANRLTYDTGEYLTFNGPGAVTEISPGGVLIANDFTPFGPTTADTNLYKVDFTLEVVRKWIAGDPPLIEVPEDAKPKPEEKPSADE